MVFRVKGNIIVLIPYLKGRIIRAAMNIAHLRRFFLLEEIKPWLLEAFSMSTFESVSPAKQRVHKTSAYPKG